MTTELLTYSGQGLTGFVEGDRLAELPGAERWLPSPEATAPYHREDRAPVDAELLGQVTNANALAVGLEEVLKLCRRQPSLDLLGSRIGCRRGRWDNFEETLETFSLVRVV